MTTTTESSTITQLTQLREQLRAMNELSYDRSERYHREGRRERSKYYQGQCEGLGFAIRLVSELLAG